MRRGRVGAVVMAMATAACGGEAVGGGDAGDAGDGDVPGIVLCRAVDALGLSEACAP